ncbi:MAG: DinB family protein [Bacteroidota bacterium]
MTALDLVKEKLAYNQWANHQMIEWLRQQKPEIYEKKVASSFPSINKLTQHIMEAEKYYFSILLEEKKEYQEEMSTEAVFEELLEIDDQMVKWLSQQAPEGMGKIIHLKRSPFLETYSTATILTHTVNHSTYHRGQLLALRQQLGMSAAPKLDYYRFFIN